MTKLIDLDTLSQHAKNISCHVGIISCIMILKIFLIVAKLNVSLSVKMVDQIVLIGRFLRYLVKYELQYRSVEFLFVMVNLVIDYLCIVESREILFPQRAKFNKSLGQWSNELLVKECDIVNWIMSHQRLLRCGKHLDNLGKSYLCVIHGLNFFIFFICEIFFYIFLTPVLSRMPIFFLLFFFILATHHIAASTVLISFVFLLSRRRGFTCWLFLNNNINISEAETGDKIQIANFICLGKSSQIILLVEPLALFEGHLCAISIPI